MDSLLSHVGDISAILVAACSLGALVSKLTPNKKDDALFAKALSLLQALPTLGLGHLVDLLKGKSEPVRRELPSPEVRPVVSHRSPPAPPK